MSSKFSRGINQEWSQNFVFWKRLENHLDYAEKGEQPWVVEKTNIGEKKQSSSFMAKYEAIGIAFSFSLLPSYYNIIIKYGTWHFCYWLLLQEVVSPPSRPHNPQSSEDVNSLSWDTAMVLGSICKCFHHCQCHTPYFSANFFGVVLFLCTVARMLSWMFSSLDDSFGHLEL